MPAEFKPVPYTDGTVEAGGVKLHYLDYGKAGKPALLCLHGGAAHAHWYDSVAKEFNQDHRVIALEGRGHGDSGWAVPPDYTYERFAQDVAEVAEKLDLRDFTLMGHSVGGVVTLLHAARYNKGRLKRMIIADSNLTSNPARVAQFMEQAKKPADTYDSREALIAAYKLNPPDTTASKAVIDYLAGFDAKQTADGRWTRKFDRAFYSQREWNYDFDIWKDVKVPVMIMKAEQGGRVTQEILDQVKLRCPQVRVAEIPASNHHVMLDNPDVFVKALKDFIAST